MMYVTNKTNVYVAEKIMILNNPSGMIFVMKNSENTTEKNKYGPRLSVGVSCQ